jgi:hypothetical protein
MASKFVKTAVMVSMCFLATAGLSLAGPPTTGNTIDGDVYNTIIDADTLINLSVGNDNKASIASINLKDTTVNSIGYVDNYVEKLESDFNAVVGDDNKAALASIEIDSSQISGAVSNFVGTHIKESGNVVLLGNGNTTAVGSILMENTNVNAGAGIYNHIEKIEHSGNIIVNGDDNTALLGTVSAKNVTVNTTPTLYVGKVKNAYNIISGNGNKHSIASMSY